MPDTACPLTEEALSAALRRNLLLAVVLGAAAAIIWYAGEVLLYAFAGLLLAVVLQAWTQWFSEKTHMRPRLSYWCVLLAVVGATATICWLIAPRVQAE